MKRKLTVALLVMGVAAVVMVGCGKRCVCVTKRGGKDVDGREYQATRGLEPLGSNKSCTDLDREWKAEADNDSTGQMLIKKCVAE